MRKHLILAAVLLTIVAAACTTVENENNMETNETVENLKTRRSIRAYKDSMPDESLLAQVIEAGTYAPTGKGLQSPIIIAVTNKEMRDSLSRMNAKVMGVETDPFYGAPAVLVVLADRSCPTYFAAHALGLGTCWIHRAKEVFDSEDGKALLESWGILGDYEGIGNCIIGYPAQAAPAPKARKADYVHYVR